VRVYFLGAGASKAFYCNLPLASELTLDSLLHDSTYEVLEQTPPVDAIQVLRSFAAGSGLPEDQRKQPIETILGAFEGHRYEYLSLQFCLAARLWVPDHADLSHLRNWLEQVRRKGDAIVTTNYDTVLERAIAKLTKAPDSRPLAKRGLLNYGVERDLIAPDYEELAEGAAPRSVTLLKLHGSISWSLCGDCKKARLHPAYRSGATDALAGTKCCCGGELWPILVGPADKRYDHPLIIARIVNTARRLLSQANEIVFVGFSMNPEDEGIRGILTKAHAIAHTQKVTIVDKKAEQLLPVYEHICGGAAIVPFPSGWQEYLHKHKPPAFG
jgi:hypothetical protein